MHPILDTVVVTTLGTVTAASAVLLADGSQTQLDFEMRLLLIPLIGSMFVSGGLILLNPQPETRRIVIGRAMLALLAGVCLPQVLSWIHPSLAGLAVKPFALLLGGGICSGLVYILSKPFTLALYKRAEGDVAERLANQVVDKFLPKEVVTTTTTTTVSPKPTDDNAQG